MPNGSGSVEATRVPEWSSFVVRGRQRPERKGGEETQTPRVDDPPGSSAGTGGRDRMISRCLTFYLDIKGKCHCGAWVLLSQ